MKDLFEIKNHHYNFRRDVRLQRKHVNTVMYGTETIVSLGTKIWNLIPKNWKCLKSLNKFEKTIQKWTKKECPCRSMQSACTEPRVCIKVNMH